MKRAATFIGLALVAVAAAAGWIYVTTNFDATGGKGWSLMAAARDRDDRFGWRFGAGDETAQVIIDPAALAAAYAELGLAGAPALNFETELAIRAIAIGSGSCPPHLDDVQLVDDRIVVHASRGFAMACSGDAVPYSFVLRVDHPELPDWPLHVEVRADGIVRESVIGPWVRDAGVTQH